ncbi:hypothetical protein FOA52_007656 [Chlamydomonas sp. UWO 241]|nr:hypothetical protein FOA52_007656 [Chlamydomonas sp. UWO 241]
MLSPTDASAGTAEAMAYSLTELSKRTGRTSAGTNLFLVGEGEESWRRLDKKVNKYPIQRTFTAIGSGGDVFKATMVKAVEGVVGTVHQECISDRSSSRGSYISVTVGPVWVESCDQIIEIYTRMKEDAKGDVKWII